MIYILLIYMGIMARLSGSGFGDKWGVSWLPELLFAVPFGIAHAWAWHVFGFDTWVLAVAFVAATGCSYLFMQSGTWLFLQWEGHNNPTTTRSATLKFIVDFIARLFGWKLGDEGYSWVAAGVKGFLIGLPIGCFPLVILWPLSYEIGSHGRGRVEKYGIDPHAITEVLSGLGAALSIAAFVSIIKAVHGF